MKMLTNDNSQFNSTLLIKEKNSLKVLLSQYRIPLCWLIYLKVTCKKKARKKITPNPTFRKSFLTTNIPSSVLWITIKGEKNKQNHPKELGFFYARTLQQWQMWPPSMNHLGMLWNIDFLASSILRVFFHRKLSFVK